MWRQKEIAAIFAFSLVVTISHTRIISSPRQARLSLAEPMPYYFHNDIDGNPGTYSYGYDVTDPATGNSQFRTEERYPNGTVVGSYGYVDPFGKPHRYTYIADERGYRVRHDLPYKQYPPHYPLHPEPLYPSRPEHNYATESSITWTRPKPSAPTPYPINPEPPQPSRPSYSEESSMGWTLPKPPSFTQSQPSRPSDNNQIENSMSWIRPKPNKRKTNNYYVHRPTHNFRGPPSSYAED